MARSKSAFVCNDCNSTYPKWMGKCTECGAFGTVEEKAIETTAPSIVGVKSKGTSTMSSPALRLKDISAESHKHKTTGIGEFDRVLGGGLVKGGVILLAGEPGVGKALALDTPIATPEGWSSIGELKVGDKVFGDDGLPANVVALSEIWENRPCYEVVFSDGSKIIADENHEWATSTRRQRLNTHAGKNDLLSGIRTTREIKDTLLYGSSTRLNHSIESPNALQLPEKELAIPPYALGAWLGDGWSHGPNLTSYDPEIIDNINNDGVVGAVPLPYGKQVFKLTVTKPVDWDVSSVDCGRCSAPYSYNGNRPNKGYCKDCQYNFYSFKGLLRELDVLDNKHIPVDYLRASEEQRRLLLAGLMDTDGTINKNGQFSIALTNKRLSYDVLELILSLGYRVNMITKQVKGRTEESSTCYIMNFTTTDSIFRLQRKKDRQVSTVRKTNGRRYITEINRVDSVPVRCIEIDNDSHLFLAGKEMIPTHNSSLLATVAHHISIGSNVLYVSGEESVQQIKIRHQRMKAEGDQLYLASENDLSKVIWHIDEIKPELIIVDSVQTIASPDIDGRAGSPSQVTEVATILTRIAKERGIPLIFVGHFTKAGDVAGPRVVEHLVDVVLSFEGESDSPLRLLRGIKNRFGPADEIGCFEHTEEGLEEVADPSGLLLSSRSEPVMGVATSIFLEGKRALPIEVQALVTASVLPNPRKVTSGLDSPKTIQIQAVMEKHGGLRLSDKDVYVSTIGGMKVKETSIDLATVIALASAQLSLISRNDAVAIGEVALSGEIRRTPGINRKLAEALRLGFNVAFVPVGTKAALTPSLAASSLKVIELKNVEHAVGAVRGFAMAHEMGIETK